MLGIVQVNGNGNLRTCNKTKHKC